MEDIEYADPVVKHQTTGDLEVCKRMFMGNQLDNFKEELKKFSLYVGEYKYSDDYDNSPDLLISNRVSGIVQQFGKNRKYYFISIKCFKDDNKYKFLTYWICNSDLKSVLGSDYDDYNWTQLTDIEEFLKLFMSESYCQGLVH